MVQTQPLEKPVLDLGDSQAALESVGGKGLSLAKLARAGLPVPGGFHVTTAAYRQFVAENELQPKILEALRGADIAVPAGLESASHTIRAIFAGSPIPAQISAAITGAYMALAAAPAAVAVRSSATAEDLPTASFAGQHDSYLNIQGAQALLEAVKACWASLWTARAIAYRIKNHIDADSVALAVVVQEMVNAEASGILFTAHPISGRRDEMLINAAWGLGEAIVGGLVSPDRIVADRGSGKVKQMDVAEKTVMTVMAEQGTRVEALSGARSKARVLTEAQVVELVSLARRIEAFYGAPQDIEWCYAGGRFSIVQSRPVTALPPEPPQWTRPNPKAMYARGSLAEHLPNPVSPLFATLGLREVNLATAALGKMIGIDPLEADYQYRVINGYVFMGFALTAKLTWAMVKVTFTSTKLMFGQGKARWLEARRLFADGLAFWQDQALENFSPSELLEGARVVMRAAAAYYTVIQSGTLPTASSSEIVFSSIYRMVKRKQDPEASTLLFGIETVALRAEKSIADLGAWIRERPRLRARVLEAPAAELAAALQAPDGADWEEFKARFAKHLDEFGHTAYEFDFLNPTPAETPELILDALKMYAAGQGSDPYARQREAAARREQTVERIRRRFKLLPNRWFNKALQWALDAAPNREDSLADMGMGHTTLRRLLHELGRRAAAGGAIDTPEDIYWLVEEEASELAARLEKNEGLPNLAERVAGRRAAWRAQMKLIPPAMLPEKSRLTRIIPWNRTDQTGAVLSGLAASPGRVTGRARVLFAPEDFGRMRPGDVLVAVITTPAWTPLFTMAAAIVTDIGGPLSHSSIIAREYGIPAVLAVGVATRRIQDGQIITVDGSAGTVELN